MPDDPPGLHRARVVSRAIRGLCHLSGGDQGGADDPCVVDAQGSCVAWHLRTRPDDRQLHLSVALLRGAAGIDLRAGACRGRPVRSRAGGAVSEPQSLLKDAAWLREGGLARLLAVLGRDGEEARVVGGAVRNALLGEPIHEFDVATTAIPDEVKRRAAAAGFKPVSTGIEHGTITVVIEGRPFEGTTLRQDVETFRRPAN